MHFKIQPKTHADILLPLIVSIKEKEIHLTLFTLALYMVCLSYTLCIPSIHLCIFSFSSGQLTKRIVDPNMFWISLALE